MTCEASAPAAGADDGVWVVIPAYNEARTIRALAEAALARCVRVLVVDDGSTDGTAEQLDGLPITLLRHPVNRGKADALRAAFRHAVALGAACVVTHRRRRSARPARPGQAARGLAPPAGPARDRRTPARSRPHSAPALLRQPHRVLLDLLGGRPPDRRHPVGLSRLSARSDGDRAGRLRELQRLHVRERDRHRRGVSRPPHARRRDRRVLSRRRTAEPLPRRSRHDEDHRHGRRSACCRKGCTWAGSGAACSASRRRRCRSSRRSTALVDLRAGSGALQPRSTRRRSPMRRA